VQAKLSARYEYGITPLIIKLDGRGNWGTSFTLRPFNPRRINWMGPRDCMDFSEKQNYNFSVLQPIVQTPYWFRW